ncbi:ATP-binding protein [Actinomycetospora endophytica]|uniref:histidine kinase n=1 Tax=Actinomycetospora endophytica TaxID=2291215 RepID=A0ABS8P9J9_9PSEU|nr:sensor histidine kinase [Actinomycetospora endophytica]MCD2194924.1 ATP-binding protein [Actinomycetospora endophytica]
MSAVETGSPQGSGGEVDQRSLSRLLALCTIIGLVVLLLGGLVTGTAMVALDRHRADLLDRLDPALVDVAQLNAALLDQETGIRGYVLGGQQAFLDPYTRGRDLEAQLAGDLRGLIGPAEGLGDLEAVEARSAQWRASYADPAIAAMNARAPAPNADAGKVAFDGVRSSLTSLTTVLTARRDAARQALDSAVGTLRLVTILVLVALALGLAVLLLWLRRVVVRPTERLAAEVRVVADGDLEWEVAVQGPREIAGLGRDVDAMRRALTSEMANIEAARRELDEQGRELQRSNSDLEQFAYVASHDLQEPLRKVASFCQLLQRRYSGELDERADQYIEFAVDGAKRMQVLINDLLAFSRVGRSELGDEVVDAGTVLDQATENLAGALEENDGRITHDRLPRVRADPVLLTTVFQNLLGNSLKFRGEAPPRAHVSATRDGDRWLLRVTDNGIGIEHEYAERIFTIFQRLHPKSTYPGTGIGLAMCRKIVEHHGGAIWLEDSAGEGTTFVVALPVLPEERSEEVPEQAPTPGATAPGNQEESRV